jgi:hypothetical protein
MRALPRRNMFRLAQAIMIACVAALGTALRAEGDSVPFYPPALRAAAGALRPMQRAWRD